MEKMQNSVPGFLTKLWTLVEDETTDDIIRWSDSGKSFQILDGGKLAKELLPLFFKHSNLASFIRQLNMYGFHKVIGGTVMERSAYSDDMEFAHSYFVRGRPELLERIKRKVTYGRSGILDPVSYPSTSARNPQVTRGANAAEGNRWGAVVPVEASRQPVRDLPRLVQQISSLQAKQSAMSQRLSSVKEENEALWRELHSLRSRHSKQQLIVNKIVQFLVSLVGQSGGQNNRFFATLKRKAGPAFGPAAITLDNKSGNGAASGSGGLALRSGGVTASNNVAAAAADLLKVASAHLNDCEDSSAGAQQTVFVEEVLDDEDISDMPVTTSSAARNVWNTNQQQVTASKRRRIMTPNGTEPSVSVSESYEDGAEAYVEDAYDDAYADDTYYDPAGVQISELESVWPSGPSGSLDVNSGNAPVTSNASNLMTQNSVPSVSSHDLDFNDLFAAIAPQTQSLGWNTQESPRTPNDIKASLRSPRSGLLANPSTTVDPTILPELSDTSTARTTLNENLESIQSQLDGLRAFLANEQYGTDDMALMELFNADSDIVPRANLPETSNNAPSSSSSSSSNQAVNAHRYPSEIVGDELVEYTDPSTKLFDFLTEPSAGDNGFLGNRVESKVVQDRGVARAASKAEAIKIPGKASASKVLAADQLNTSDANAAGNLDDSQKRPFVVKTFTPTNTSATVSRPTVAPTSKRN